METFKGPGPFTVFAPTDAAFAKLPAGALDSLLANIETGARGGGAASLVALNEQLAGILDTVEGADAEPTSQVVAAAGSLEKALAALLSQWSDIQRTRIRPDRK